MIICHDLRDIRYYSLKDEVKYSAYLASLLTIRRIDCTYQQICKIPLLSETPPFEQKQTLANPSHIIRMNKEIWNNWIDRIEWILNIAKTRNWDYSELRIKEPISEKAFLIS